MRRTPTLFEAAFPIIFMVLLLFIGVGVFNLQAVPLLIISACVAGLIAIRVGLTWDEMLAGIRQKVDTALPAILILVTIGLLIGVWMISGVIPMILYYGIQIVDPQFIYIIAFVVTMIVSIITGTSWGSVGTVGVALIGIATVNDVSLAITAGAIVSGSFFGDKMSPISESTNMSAAVVGVDLYEHIRHMLYTTVPGMIICAIIYTFLGLNMESNSGVTTEITAILQSLQEMFQWNLLLLLPPLIVLGGSLLKKPVLPTIIASSIVASILAFFIQGFSLPTILNTAVDGFNVAMVEAIGLNPIEITASVATLLNRGGLSSMMGVTLLIFAAFSFAGIISETGSLKVLMDALLRKVQKTGGLIGSTVASCLVTIMATGSVYLTILIPGETFKRSYEERNLHPKNLSRTVEDAGTMVSPIIPWTEAGIYVAGILGVSTFSYAPYAFLCYLGFIFAIIYGYTGFGIAKITNEKEEDEDEGLPLVKSQES